jgi:hypothetical protein
VLRYSGATVYFHGTEPSTGTYSEDDATIKQKLHNVFFALLGRELDSTLLGLTDKLYYKGKMYY